MGFSRPQVFDHLDGARIITEQKDIGRGGPLVSIVRRHHLHCLGNGRRVCVKLSKLRSDGPRGVGPRCYDRTTSLTQIRRTTSFISLLVPFTVALYDMISRLVNGVSCTIGSGGFDCATLYDINLRATHTTIPSTRGVEIHISLVSSATDSVW